MDGWDSVAYSVVCELFKVSAVIHSHRVMACFIFPGIDNASQPICS